MQMALDRWLCVVSALFFFLGAQLYAQRKPGKVAAGLVALVLGAWAFTNAAHLFNTVSVVVPSSLLFVAVASVFWQESRRQETLADRLLAVSFVALSVLPLVGFFFFRHAPGGLGIQHPDSPVAPAVVA